MRQYPIWFNVVDDCYKSSKSFGVKKSASIHVNVGSSSSYSRHLGEFCIRSFMLDENIKVFVVSYKFKELDRMYYNLKTKTMSEHLDAVTA